MRSKIVSPCSLADMQAGILSQLKNPEQITLQVLKVLTAARDSWSARLLFAPPFAAKRIDGHVSVPHGHDLAAADGFA